MCDFLEILEFLYDQNAIRSPPALHMEDYNWILLAIPGCPSNYTYFRYRRKQNGGDGQREAKKLNQDFEYNFC